MRNNKFNLIGLLLASLYMFLMFIFITSMELKQNDITVTPSYIFCSINLFILYILWIGINFIADKKNWNQIYPFVYFVLQSILVMLCFTLICLNFGWMYPLIISAKYNFEVLLYVQSCIVLTTILGWDSFYFIHLIKNKNQL